MSGIRADIPQQGIADDMLPWVDIAEGIITLACKDYRQAYRRHLVHPTKDTEMALKQEQRFFRSDWFGVLTDCDGELILSRLEEEVRSKIKKVKVGCAKEKPNE